MSRSPVGPVQDQDQTGTGPKCTGPRSGPGTVPRWSGPGPGLAWISGTALVPDGTGPGPDQCRGGGGGVMAISLAIILIISLRNICTIIIIYDNI